MHPFLDALDHRVLVCDGAMGTLLYSQGVFINRSFDSLNLSDPARVTAVHEAYASSGADVLETNTFGASRIKLRAFGLEDRLYEINQAGVRLARAAARGSAYVAGAIGPLGLRIEPWGRMSREDAQKYFEEQAAALAAAGVDLFILETFRDLNEIGAAIAAVRAVCPLPIVAQMTIEDDGHSLDGTPPEQFAPVLSKAGVDVIGLNCSIGPAHMLETLERMAAATGARLSAQPNAGRPREVEGRTIYLTSPEYMASYARRFADRGVRLVGGCCGTTPEHIAQMKRALTRSTRPSGVRIGPTVTSAGTAAASNLPQSPQPSALMTALRERGWARLVELMPPIGFAMASATEQARRLRARGVDAVHIPEAPSGPRLQAMSMAVLLQQQAQIDTLLEYSSRDKPLVGMQSELLGAFAMGVRNLLAVTGDVRQVGDYTDATAVLDVDSIGLVNAVSRLNRGLGVGGQSIGDPTAFHVGVTVNPGADDLENELRRFEWKVEAGAHFIITRPIFDVAAFERMHRRIEDARLPLVLSLRPFASLLDAEYQANEVPGVRVPKEVLDRIRRCDDAAAEGVAIAGEVGRALRPMVHGVNIVPPAGRLDLGLLLLDALD